MVCGATWAGPGISIVLKRHWKCCPCAYKSAIRHWCLKYQCFRSITCFYNSQVLSKKTNRYELNNQYLFQAYYIVRNCKCCFVKYPLCIASHVLSTLSYIRTTFRPPRGLKHPAVTLTKIPKVKPEVNRLWSIEQDRGKRVESLKMYSTCLSVEAVNLSYSEMLFCKFVERTLMATRAWKGSLLYQASFSENLKGATCFCSALCCPVYSFCSGSCWMLWELFYFISVYFQAGLLLIYEWVRVAVKEKRM